MNDQTTRGLGLALLLGLLAGPASADPYFGGASGRAGMEDFAPRSGDFIDDDATSEKYFFGFELGHHMKVEIDRVNFGPLDGSIPEQLELDGTSYSVLFESGVAPRTHAFVRFGRFNWDGTDRGALLPSEQSGNDGLWGVGLTYELTRKISLRAEWERYDMGPYKVDMPSLGLVIEL